MKSLFPGIWQWSWFSEEKQLNFNGHFLMVGEHRIVVDPPFLTAEASTLIRRQGQLDYIIVTNRDHAREAATCQAVSGSFICKIRNRRVNRPSSSSRGKASSSSAMP